MLIAFVLVFISRHFQWTETGFFFQDKIYYDFINTLPTQIQDYWLFFSLVDFISVFLFFISKIFVLKVTISLLLICKMRLKITIKSCCDIESIKYVCSSFLFSLRCIPQWRFIAKLLYIKNTQR